MRYVITGYVDGMGDFRSGSSRVKRYIKAMALQTNGIKLDKFHARNENIILTTLEIVFNGGKPVFSKKRPSASWERVEDIYSLRVVQL